MPEQKKPLEEELKRLGKDDSSSLEEELKRLGKAQISGSDKRRILHEANKKFIEHVFGEDHPEKAKPALRRAVEVCPDESNFYFALAMCSGFKDDEAEEALKKAAEIDPNEKPGLGECYFIRGKYKEAEAIFEELTRLKPDAPYFNKRLIECHLRQGKFKEALLEDLRRFFDSSLYTREEIDEKIRSRCSRFYPQLQSQQGFSVHKIREILVNAGHLESNKSGTIYRNPNVNAPSPREDIYKKNKRKILEALSSMFEKGVVYSNKEVASKIKDFISKESMYEAGESRVGLLHHVNGCDITHLRRGLIDLGYLERNPSGTIYIKAGQSLKNID